jgi:hypothetical protein
MADEHAAGAQGRVLISWLAIPTPKGSPPMKDFAKLVVYTRKELGTVDEYEQDRHGQPQSDPPVVFPRLPRYHAASLSRWCDGRLEDE